MKTKEQNLRQLLLGNSKEELVDKLLALEQEIIRRDASEVSLRHDINFYKKSEQLASVGYWEWSYKQDKMLSCSEEYAQIFGMTIEEALNVWSSIESDISNVHPDDAERYKKSMTEFDNNDETDKFNMEYRIARKDGKYRFIHEVAEKILDKNASVIGSFGITHDITERKNTEYALHKSEARLKLQMTELRDQKERLENQAENLISMAEGLHAAKEEMKFLANHDSLTGLPSLRLCREHLMHALDSDKRNGTQTALLFIDLDEFKAVNDTMGHDAGDRVLQSVAEQLTKSVRKIDTAARIGGDEFMILLRDIKQKEDAGKVAKNIIDSLSKPITVNGGDAQIGASIGIAISPANGTEAEELIRKADQSMYEIKQHGKNSFGYVLE